MKKILQYIILTTLCVGSYLSAQSEQIIRDASVRVIRFDDLKDAIKTKSGDPSKIKLPPSCTGFLVQRKPKGKGDHGAVVTYIDVAVSARKNEEGEITGYGVDNYQAEPKPTYLVVMPIYNSEGRVVAVRGYKAVLAAEPDQRTRIAVLNISPEASLPAIVRATKTPVKVKDNVTMIGFRKYTGTADGTKEILNCLDDLSSVPDNTFKQIDVEGTNKRESFMGYMGISRMPYKVAKISDDSEPWRRIELSSSADYDSLGCAIVGDENYMVGMYAGYNGNGNIATGDDYASINAIIKVSTREDMGFQLSWMWIGVGAVVLLIIGGLVLIIVKKSGKSKKRRKPILRLHGEDGSWHDLSSADLRRGVTLGRSSRADRIFTKDSISRIHALMSALEGRVVIIDKESKGGTFVNGERLTPGQPRKLHNGDEVCLSDFKIRVETLSNN